jgi:GDPmannose 4,6-dehydratase
MNKKALITGINGQDGSLLADFLLERNYTVHGTVRCLVEEDYHNISHIMEDVTLHACDLLGDNELSQVLEAQEFDEVYHLAAVTFVPDSKNNSELIIKVNTCSLQLILDYILKKQKNTKVFYASSAEVYGSFEGEVDESTPPQPNSVYGLSKQLGQNMIDFYKNKGVFCCYGILFNHESPRRGERFVTRKITKGVAKIKNGKSKELVLGNIEAFRDWGSAEDFVEAYYLMLQSTTPENYVIGTGEAHNVRELLSLLFSEVGLNFENYIKISQDFYRDESKVAKVAKIEKIRKNLNWNPTKDFSMIFLEMLEKDLK